MTASPETETTPSPSGRPRTVVVGGGLAGVAAATVLAERGLAVTLIEREPHLGGRVGAWPQRLSTGETLQMERGFHAFFRQYYNLRALLRRVDPDLRHLRPLDDYPILGPGGAVESFASLPRRTPWNLIELVRRSPSLRLREVLRVDKRAALEMLRFERRRTYARYDGLTAKSYLDSLHFAEHARRMLFEVFAHSFFSPEEEYSAAELLLMFHFYFVANPEGLVFDALDEPFSTVLWQPFEGYLRGLGVDVRLATSAVAVERVDGLGWRVRLPSGAVVDAEGVVLALDVRALVRLVEASPTLDDPDWRRAVASLRPARPFAVWRLWLDGPTKPGRAPFAGTTGYGLLDNISLYHLFEGESRGWAQRHGGSVVELHAYALPEGCDEARVRAELRAMLHRAYPETSRLGVLDEVFLMRSDCPAFAPGSDATRPGVETPFAGVALAGDLVRLAVPSALMERAALSGFLAANHLLAGWGRALEPVQAIEERGLLATPAWLEGWSRRLVARLHGKQVSDASLEPVEHN